MLWQHKILKKTTKSTYNVSGCNSNRTSTLKRTNLKKSESFSRSSILMFAHSTRAFLWSGVSWSFTAFCVRADFLLDWEVQFRQNCAYRSMCLLVAFLDYKMIFLPCSLALRFTIFQRNSWKWFRWLILRTCWARQRERSKNAPPVLRLSPAAISSNNFLDDSFINRLIISHSGKQSINGKSKI